MIHEKNYSYIVADWIASYIANYTMTIFIGFWSTTLNFEYVYILFPWMYILKMYFFIYPKNITNIYASHGKEMDYKHLHVNLGLNHGARSIQRICYRKLSVHFFFFISQKSCRDAPSFHFLFYILWQWWDDNTTYKSLLCNRYLWRDIIVYAGIVR